MVTERIVGPDNSVIFNIYQTDYFQDILNMEDKDAQFFSQREKEQEEDSPRFQQLLLPTV